MTVYYATPADLESLPTPAAEVSITSSTDASPLVITAAAAHGLQTGQPVIVNNHATNTNANGIHIATVLTSTTYKISTFGGFPGTFINGNGAGAGSGGTSQGLALPGFTLPEDLVTARDVASVNVPLEALGDMVAWLAYRILAKMTILKGGTLDTASGSTSTFAGDVGLSGAVVANNTTVLIGSGARLQIGATSRSNQYVQRLADGDHTISADQGGIVYLAQPTAARTITLEQGSDGGLANYDTIEIYMPDPGAAGIGYYTIKREGSGTSIGQLDGVYPDTTTGPAMVRVHVEGGVWRGTGGYGMTPLLAGAGGDW